MSLPKHARVVVIGCGIVGNSVAYHLGRLGWRDIVLLDKGPLPNPGGSTGHASNFIYLVDHSKEMTALTVESVRQYRELGVFTESGGIEVARTPERMQELTRRMASAKSWGIEPVSLVTPDEVKKLVPYIDERIILGGFSIQPGEFARIALAVFFAGYLVRKRDVLSLAGRRFLGIDLPRGRDMGPILVLWAIAMLILIFESDIGVAALFFGLFVAMLYIATQRKSWLLIGILMFVAGALLAGAIIPHVAERFTIWRHPFAPANIQGSSYQLVQGLEGMAFGGIFGTGLGAGQPFRTPLVQSDFIFTGLGEELGLTGLMALLLIFGLLVQRGLRAALAVRDPFAKLLAAGVSFVLALQVFIIVGGVTQLIPLTGITTPFLSQGGSSLVASWTVIALLMRISDTARRPAPQPIQDEGLTQVVRAV